MNESTRKMEKEMMSSVWLVGAARSDLDLDILVPDCGAGLVHIGGSNGRRSTHS